MADIPGFRQTLQRVKQFEGLPEQIQLALAASAVHRRYHSGQVIYLEGEPADSFFILESGWVKSTRMTRDGREQAMLFLGPYEMFGDIAVLTGGAYPGTVLALEDAAVWVIPAQTMYDLIQNQPAFAMLIIRRLAQRIVHYINLVEDLSLRTVEARLAHYLLNQGVLIGQQLVAPRREWATFDQLAVRLGTVRDVLSRALKTLETEGLLKVEKQRIILLDPAGLAERANR